MWIFKHYLHNYKLLLLSSFQANAESFVWNEQETSTSKLEKAQSPEELKYQEIKSELEITAASKWVVGSNEKILREGLLAKWDPQDPEYMQLAQKVQNLQSEYKDILNQEQDLNQELLLLSWSVQEKVDMVTESEINRMKTISNAEFLAAPDSERLQYISKNHIDSEKIASWEVADVEFTFTFDGQYNQELYLETTAGQVLPNEVWEVIVDGEAFSRTSVEGEFFNQDWKRLTIHEGTQVNISQLRTADELQSFINIHNDNLSKYPDAMNQTIALEAMNRWIDPDFAILAYGEKMSELPKDQQKIYLEQEMTQFDRIAGEQEIPKNQLDQDGKHDINICITVLEKNFPENYEEKLKDYGFNENEINEANIELWNINYKGDLTIEELTELNISSEDFERIEWMNKFEAGSKDAQMLFSIALKQAWLPTEWSSNEGLHYILKRESAGVVWRLNYTIQWLSPDEFRDTAINSTRNNPIGARSTASWLGQLLLSNVDKYYPNGRQWIGNPIEEAVWLIAYIHDRYGSPDVAASVYWKVWNYTHAVTGDKMNKWFKEGY